MYLLKRNPKSTQSIYKVNCRSGYPCLYMTKEGKEIKETYKWELKTQKAKIKTGELALSLHLFFNTKGKHDIDNFCKLILDSGTGILWDDDSQITRLLITKNYDKTNPRAEIEVIEL